jgi:hypothetical protein
MSVGAVVKCRFILQVSALFGICPNFSAEISTRSSLFPLALQYEGCPVIWLSPLFLFPDRQLGLA